MRYIGYILIPIVALCVAACGKTTEKADGTNEASGYEEVTEEPTGDPALAEYIVIAKESMSLRLYDSNNALICRFNVATGKHAGNKQEPGDMKTPEGEFTIKEIIPSHHWTHDFGDGRGAIKGCYGNWFIQLDIPEHKGIGIHGAYDPQTIGTRATDGCIILEYAALDSIQPLLRAGMRVTITPGRLDCKADGVEMPVPQPIKPEPTEAPEVEPQEVEVEGAEVEESVTTDTPAAETPAQKPEVIKEKATAPVETAKGEDVWHTVVDGDLVGRIAQKYGTTTAEIRRLNPNINIDRISIGQRIKVKGTPTASDTTPKVAPEVKPAAPAPAQPKADATTTANSEEVWHTVVDGDLVGRIAQKYGTTTAEIRRLNPDINIDRISIGQRIKVKGSPKVATVIPESNVAPAANSEEVWYTVVDGDLVGRIAQRYGTTSAKIAELNPDINIDRISIGQRIRVK